MAGWHIGVIGGSGLYEPGALDDVQTIAVGSAFGAPSSPVTQGRIGDVRLSFIARHGEGHRISPWQVNYRANIDALKRVGVTDLVSFSACGSFREDLPPGTFVLVDDFVDRTFRRESTFFGRGCVAHVPFAHPVSPGLADLVEQAARAERIPHRRGGTAVCMEGPQFSTRAESRLYRTWGVSVIGMTSMPEAKLAREAELPFATLALATDYDCWHDAHDDVTVEAVVATMKKNVSLAKKALVELASALPEPTKSVAHRAAHGAVMTAPTAMTDEVRARLAWLLGDAAR